MFKICCVVDKELTAIDRLATGAAKYHDRFDFKVVAVHPKRPSPQQLQEFEEHAKDADLIDFQYFKTAYKIMELFPWVKDKKKILAHHNPYSIAEGDWNEFDAVVANNKTIYEQLKTITKVPVEYIPNTIDTDFWAFNLDWKPNKKVLMVANRIESKKGIKEVAQACEKIGADFILVGAVSDPDYFRDVLQQTNVKFHQQITDEELRDLYYNSSVHVCNSVDNFESGTNPMLEAMLCGTPVLTRMIGHVPELYNGENMVIHEGSNEDVGKIAELLGEMLNDPEKLKGLREKAWDTAKTRSHERRAFMYQQLYRSVIFPSETPVTIIMPVCDKPELTEDSLKAIEAQTYKNIELIMVNDGEFQQPEVNTPFFKKISSFQGDYGLARARNLGIIEATGDIVVFCDQRIVMEPDAVEQFVKNIKPRIWLYGTKGTKKDFVENFSAINREDIIKMGMFCERIDKYGGMSQEARTRARYQGIKTEFLESAKAVQIGKSSNKNRRREEIIKMKNRLWRMYG